MGRLLAIGTLALLAGGAAAGGCVGAEEGEIVCPAYEVACDGLCFDPLRDPRHCGGCGIRCGTGEICDGGTCTLRCPTGLTACDGACRDLDSDATNCGACRLVCGEGGVCIDGECRGDCIGCVGDIPEDHRGVPNSSPDNPGDVPGPGGPIPNP